MILNTAMYAKAARAFLWILVFSILLPGCSSNLSPNHLPEIPFRHFIIDPHPNTGADCCTDVCAIGDLNGDGYLDVVIGAENADSSGLVWYEYPYWIKHPVGSGQFTTDGQTGDVDRDGDLDIIVGDFGSGIFWYENPGVPTFDPWTPHKIGAGYAHDLEVGDIDRDGDLDAVTCDKQQVVLWQQVNPTQWTGHTLLTKSGEGTALADLDRDGDMDVVYGGMWLEAPDSLYTASWPQHIIDGSWSSVTRAKAADMNGDGRLDVILSVSEGRGNLAWFEAPVDPKTGPWRRHIIESSELEGAHSLQVADLDNDQDLDVVTAEMHTSPQKRIIVYMNDIFNQEGEAWTRQIVAASGSHNMRVGDIGNDGDIDLIGKNYGGIGRKIEMWENLLAKPREIAFDSLPAQFKRSRAYPNPFSLMGSESEAQEMHIEFVVPSASEVVLQVFNLLGQSLRTITNGQHHAGVLRFRWDGKDDRGIVAPPGLYFFRLQTSQPRLMSKVLLLR